MEKLEIASLQKKGDLTKPDEAKPGDHLLYVMRQPLIKTESNVRRVHRELTEAGIKDKKEREKQRQLEKAEELAHWVQSAEKRRRLIVRHNMHRDGILLEDWKKVLELNEKCKLLAWRLATTPGGKDDPDWYPTFKGLQRARKKRDKAIMRQERAWEYAKKGLDWKKEREKQAADRDKKLRLDRQLAKQARKKALRDAKRLDVLEHEKRLLQMELARAKVKNTQWDRVEEGRKRFMKAHGKALEVPGATSES